MEPGPDIPLVQKLDAAFFEYGDDGIEDKSTPERSRSEQLWGYPGRRPVSALDDPPNSPLMAYRWADTDAALPQVARFTQTGSLIKSAGLGQALAKTIGDGVGCLIPRPGRPWAESAPPSRVVTISGSYRWPG